MLRVYPNPWLATDAEGLPCAVVPTDPEGDGGGPGQFVGARVDRKRTEVLQDFGDNAKHELRSPMQRTRYQYQGIASNDPDLGPKLFATEAIELPATKYYKQRLREGALFAADEATAKAAKSRFTPAAELAKRFAPLAPAAAEAPALKAGDPPQQQTATLEPGAPPLSAGETLGDLEPAPETEPLPEPPKGKGSKHKSTERA